MFCITHDVSRVHTEAPEQSPVGVGAAPLELEAHRAVDVLVWPAQAPRSPEHNTHRDFKLLSVV